MATMIFVTGGIGSGKRNYVLAELGFKEHDLTTDPFDDKPVYCGLQDLIRERGSLDEHLKAALLKKKVVLSDEVGCGIVPLQAEERAWRDEVGRAASALAREATMVVRMVCGIPQVIQKRSS